MVTFTVRAKGEKATVEPHKSHVMVTGATPGLMRAIEERIIAGTQTVIIPGAGGPRRGYDPTDPWHVLAGLESLRDDGVLLEVVTVGELPPARGYGRIDTRNTAEVLSALSPAHYAGDFYADSPDLPVTDLDE